MAAFKTVFQYQTAKLNNTKPQLLQYRSVQKLAL